MKFLFQFIIIASSLLFLIFSASFTHAWNYTLSLKKEKRVAVVLGVFGHTEFGKTQVSITNLIIEPANKPKQGDSQQQQQQQQTFTAKAWLELRKVKSITAAKKMKKQIEKEEIASCQEIENSRLGQDEGDETNDQSSTTQTQQQSPLASSTSNNKPVVMKSYLKYLKAQPHEEEDDLKANVIFTTKEAGLYALFLARCISPAKKKVVVSASSIKVSQYNPKYSATTGGIEVGSTYLPVGETPLPTLYGGFGLIFAVGTFLWYRELSRVAVTKNSGENNKAETASSSSGGNVVKPATVMKIHYAMLFVGGLKALTLFLESGVFAHRNTTGATGATVDVVFVLVAAAKTAILFIIIILLGTGWSISKAVVTEREQKLILGVLVVQIVVNIALASLEEGAPVGVETVERLRLGLRILDVLCALMILIPIILRAKSHHESSVIISSSSSSSSASVNINDNQELERVVDGEEEVGAGDEEGKDSQNQLIKEAGSSSDEKELHRLRTFRTFYISTFVFLYFTRLVVPYLEKHLSYLFIWVSHLLYELAALAFYFMACKLFHPENLNPNSSAVSSVGSNRVLKKNPNYQKGPPRPEDLEEVTF